jgi:hypothetical protein
LAPVALALHLAELEVLVEIRHLLQFLSAEVEAEVVPLAVLVELVAMVLLEALALD